MQFSIPRVMIVLVCCALSVQQADASWFSILPSEIPETPIEDWHPKAGDSLLVDTEMNIGYLVHENGGFTSFPVATGQRRVVNYIGRTYNAATPDRHWLALSKEQKGDRITFGKDGTFFRLSYDGEETSYGIHSHAYADTMLGHQMRYRSMGCIIVSLEVLDTIGQTFDLNKGLLDVLTVNGFGDGTSNYATLKELLSTTAS